MIISGIYKIVNPINKVYIGCTIDWERRLDQYKGLRVKGQSKIYDSLIEYGYENHTFELIETCPIEQLYEKEIYYINYYNSVVGGLNIRLGGRNGSLTDETKQKISKALKGRKNIWFKNGPLGYKHTEEQKQKMRKPRINKWKRNKLFSEDLIKEIRIKYKIKTKSELSREYNVSWGTIKNIVDKINSYK